MKWKQLLLSLLIMSTFVFFPQVVNAATATVSISSSKSKPVVGNSVSVTFKISSSSALGSWQYQISYPTSLFTFKSCSTNSLNQAGVVANNTTKSTSVTCYFTAKKSGSGSFTIKNYDIFGMDEKKMTTTISPAYVTVITQAQLEASYSKDNNLKSLSISNGELTPAFNKNTTTYSVELPNGTTKTTIKGTVSDSSASVSGLGSKTLKEGLNQFKIVVTAENGSTKTYTLNITVKELEPITVTIEDQEYNVVRKASLLEQPNKNFVEKEIQIEEKSVPAYYNEVLNYTLVGLQDQEGNIEYYKYNEEENTYTKYKDYTFEQLILEIKENKENIPENYQEAKITINDEEITAYKISDTSEFALFNAINIKTGKEELYLYDSIENTIQRYYNDDLQLEKKENETKKETYELIILVLIIALVITYFFLLISLIRKERKRSKYEKRLKQEKIEHNKKEEEKKEKEQKNEKTEPKKHEAKIEKGKNNNKKGKKNKK